MNAYDSHKIEYIAGILQDLRDDIPHRVRMSQQFRTRTVKNLSKCEMYLKQVDTELTKEKDANMDAKTAEDMSD